MKSDFLDTLEDRVLIGDGAMGTELYARGVGLDVNFDELNVTRPDLVQSVHQDYVQAGARFWKRTPTARAAAACKAMAWRTA